MIILAYTDKDISHLLRIHVGMNLVDGTSGRVERHVSDIALEKGSATQLDKAELAGIDIERGQLLLFAMERQTDATRNVDIETALLLVLSGRILLGIGAVQVFNTHIIRYAREVVLIDNAQLLAQAKDDLALHFLLRAHGDDLLSGIALSSACEE